MVCVGGVGGCLGGDGIVCGCWVGVGHVCGEMVGSDMTHHTTHIHNMHVPTDLNTIHPQVIVIIVHGCLCHMCSIAGMHSVGWLQWHSATICSWNRPLSSYVHGMHMYIILIVIVIIIITPLVCIIPPPTAGRARRWYHPMPLHVWRWWRCQTASSSLV